MSEAKRDLLRVFLASPSDLESERRLSRDAVERVNRVLRTIEWSVELLGWEDRLPGYGRPQALINQDVDACDLFIGVVWRRWGSPTAEFGSGFEEELERARTRRRQTGRPEIWIFLKQIEPEQVDDPGEQLRRVLLFRQQLERENELLFNEFASPEAWRARIHDDLLAYVLQIHEKRRQDAASEQVPRTPVAPETVPPVGAQSSNGSPAPADLLAILEALTRAGASSVDELQAKASSLSKLEIARLFLLAACWMSRIATQEPLDVHAANLIYLFRNSIQLTPFERGYLIRSMVAEGNAYVPGWYWLKDLAPDRVAAGFREIAANDPTSAFRAAFLKMLAKAPGFDVHPIAADEIAELLVADDEGVVDAALEYAGERGGIELIVTIERAAAEGSAHPTKAERAILRILFRHDPDGALSRIGRTRQSPDRETIESLRRISHELRSETLKQSMDHPDAGLRALAISELAARGEVSEQSAKKFLGDPSPVVRGAAIRALIGFKSSPSSDEVRRLIREAEPKQSGLSLGLFDRVDVDGLILAGFQTLPYEDLEKRIDWFSLDGPTAYQAIASMHLERWTTRLREDLRTDFDQIHKSSVERMREKFGEASNEIVESWAKLELKQFVNGQFAAAALTAIAEDPEPGDAALARRHLESSHPGARDAAVKVLALTGDDTDIERLTAAAKASYGSVAALAARAAIQLSSRRWEIASRFLDDGNAVLVAAAVEALKAELGVIDWEVLEAHLYSTNATIRISVAALFAEALPTKELDALLERYPTKSSTYYYDVVVRLDAALFAPRVPANVSAT